MDEFASGALVAAVRKSLAGQGIPVPAQDSTGAALAPGQNALVPLGTKRALLADVARKHGLLPLLRVGQVLPTLPPDPALSALTAATTPGDLFERWNRLERFVHSRHRVEVHEVSTTHLVAEHVGRTSRPEPAEDAVVLGVLVALLTMIGTQEVAVTLEPHGQKVFADNHFTAPAADHGTALWRFGWSSVPLPAPARQDIRVDHLDLAERAHQVLSADLPARWTVQCLAAHLGLSPRTLQRRLQPDGGFAAVLATARADAAADLLMNTAHPLGVVGFACGYTDQPHLTREFRRRTAMTPAAYRTAFARPPENEATA
ncbi:helix-turn-helix transcriptional regulator [Lentzea sp. NPDC058450]|uniref:helix-turn-helix transcriptional regulator n=1 Tax=Lentzea sp. NPDC058450 TaxID=3346505 RepID=UPI0036640034